MIICHCTGATDRDVRRCVRDGARTLADVGRQCGAGAACGGCRELVEALIRAELKAEERAKAPLTAA